MELVAARPGHGSRNRLSRCCHRFVDIHHRYRPWLILRDLLGLRILQGAAQALVAVQSLINSVGFQLHDWNPTLFCMPHDLCMPHDPTGAFARRMELSTAYTGTTPAFDVR